jgi:hypothetical protein
VEGALGYGTGAERWYVVLTIALAAIQVVAMFALLACVFMAYDRTRQRLLA